MAQTVSMIVSPDDSALGRDHRGSKPALKHIQRARIALFSGERLLVLEVARLAGISRSVVWRWQRRYAEEGVEGLLCDKTQLPRKPGRSEEGDQSPVSQAD